MAYTYLQELNDPDELEKLPVASVINDNGLRAEKLKTNVWRYPNGEFWEPAWFPCLLVWVPEFGWGTACSAYRGHGHVVVCTAVRGMILLMSY